MRVIKDRQSRCAIVISEAPDSMALVRLEEGTGRVVLDLHPMVWGENPSTGEMFYRNGDVSPSHIKWSFEEMWRPVIGSDGHPYTAQEAARKFLRGVSPKMIPEFGSGAVESLQRCLPEGDVHLFTAESGFGGRYAAIEDALLIARSHRQKPITFESPKDIKKLSEQELNIVQTSLDPDRKWPQQVNPQEIFTMAKEKQAAAPKKVQKVEASKRRADGPVAKLRELFAKMVSEVKGDSKAVLAAAAKLGINKGTTTVQLGKWRKENGIQVQRGGANNVKAKAGTKPAKKEKPAAKVKTKQKAEPAAKAKSPAPKVKKGGGAPAMDQPHVSNEASAEQPAA